MFSRSFLRESSSSLSWPGRSTWATMLWSHSWSLNHAWCESKFFRNQLCVLMTSHSLSRYALICYSFLTCFSLLLFSYVGPIHFLPVLNSRLMVDNFWATVHTYFLPSSEAPFGHCIWHWSPSFYACHCPSLVPGRLLARLGISVYLLLCLDFSGTHSSMFRVAGLFWWQHQSSSP